MESQREKTPSSAEQQGEIVNAVSTSGQVTSEGPSSSTDSLSSNSIPDNLDHPTEMNKNGGYFIASVQYISRTCAGDIWKSLRMKMHS